MPVARRRSMYPDKCAALCQQHTTATLWRRRAPWPCRVGPGCVAGKVGYTIIRMHRIPYFEQRWGEPQGGAEAESCRNLLAHRPNSRPPQQYEPLSALQAEGLGHHVWKNTVRRPSPSNRIDWAHCSDRVSSVPQKQTPHLHTASAYTVADDSLHSLIIRQRTYSPAVMRAAPTPSCQFPADIGQTRPIIMMQRRRSRVLRGKLRLVTGLAPQ